tara:strand:- start:2544 stop:2849 length:306 start_codon:yes stop_codon:yes gene_type:complete
MAISSSLNIQTFKNEPGSSAMTFGSGGSITFNGSFGPNAYAFNCWEDAKARPTTGLTIGGMGYNIQANAIEVYAGVDAEGNALWAVFSGTLMSDQDLGLTP